MIRPIFWLLLLILMSVTLCECNHRGRIPKADMHPTAESTAIEMYGSDFLIQVNLDSSIALVTKKVKTRVNEIFPTIHLFVFDQNKGTVLFKDVLPQGKVFWLNNFEISAESIPGRYNDSASHKKYILDVRTGLIKTSAKG